MADTTFPQTFVKGDRAMVAHNPADAVKAKFAGFKLAGQGTPGEIDYQTLQAQAKARGIAANQSKEALIAAIAETPLPQEPAPAEPTELAEEPAAAQPE